MLTTFSSVIGLRSSLISHRSSKLVYLQPSHPLTDSILMSVNLNQDENETRETSLRMTASSEGFFVGLQQRFRRKVLRE